MYASPARNLFFSKFYLLVYSPSFSPKLSLDFLSLVVAKAASCVDSQNKIGRPAYRNRSLTQLLRNQIGSETGVFLHQAGRS